MFSSVGDVHYSGNVHTGFANAMGYSLILHIAVLVFGPVMVSRFSDDRSEAAPG